MKQYPNLLVFGKPLDTIKIVCSVVFLIVLTTNNNTNKFIVVLETNNVTYLEHRSPSIVCLGDNTSLDDNALVSRL